MDAKATDSFRDRNLSANSCGLLRLRLESDWSQNNKHSRNNFRRSWFSGFHYNSCTYTSTCIFLYQSGQVKTCWFYDSHQDIHENRFKLQTLTSDKPLYVLRWLLGFPEKKNETTKYHIEALGISKHSP